MNRSTTSGRTAEIRSLDGADPVDGPLFAVNWINTRWALLYNVYMALAGRLVRKIDGVPVFKGHTEETLAGSAADARDILLIVRYPSASGFLSLVDRRAFQLVSLLRIAAVGSFSFVFGRRIDVGPTEVKRPIAKRVPAAYAALMYASDGEAPLEFAKLERAAGRHGVAIHFHSVRTASLALLRAGGSGREIPYVTDRVAILCADSNDQLQSFAESGIERTLGSVTGFWMGRMERSI